MRKGWRAVALACGCIALIGLVTACGDEEATPTGSGGGSVAGTGAVTPLERRSTLQALAEPPWATESLDTVTFEGTFASFDDSRIASSMGADGLGRTSAGNASAVQKSSFSLDVNQHVTAFSYYDSTSTNGWVNEGGLNPSGSLCMVRAESTFRFEFTVEDTGLILVADGEYRVDDSTFCVFLDVIERDSSQSTTGDLEFDVCEEIGPGVFTFNDTMGLEIGRFYEVYVSTQTSDYFGTSSDNEIQTSGSAVWDVDFRIERQ